MGKTIELPIPGVLNNAQPPEELTLQEMQTATNCEMRRRGRLDVRKGEVDSYINDGWKALVSASEVSGDIEDWYIWNSPQLPEGCYDDEVIVVYSSVKRLYVIWRTAAEVWTAESVSVSGVTFDAPTFEFRPGRQVLLVTDNQNYPFRIWFDADKVLQAGMLRVPNPVEHATLSAYGSSYDSTWFEETSSDDKLGDCAIVQMAYTVIDEYGAEGNPSPRSFSLNMQLFAKDADTGEDARWLDRIKADNLKLPPDLDEGTLDRQKYFGIYLSMARNSNGTAYAPLLYSVRVPIYAKYDESGDPLPNEYVLTQMPDGSIQASYGNLGAPISAHICENAGIIQLGDIRTRMEFLWDSFKYYHRIEINNPNLGNMTDANIVLKLDQSSINNLTVADFAVSDGGGGGGGPSMANTGHIRIFDADRMTPLAVNLHRIDLDDDFLLVEVRIPQLLPKQQNYVYLLWNPASVAGTGTYTGAPAAYNTFEYGKFFAVNVDTWSEQLVVPTDNRVRNDNHVICTSEEVALQDAFADAESASITVPNVADTNNCGASEEDSSASHAEFVGLGSGSALIKLYGEDHNNNAIDFGEKTNWIELDNVGFENGQFTVFGFCKMDRLGVALNTWYSLLFSCGQSGDTWDFFGLRSKAVSSLTTIEFYDSNGGAPIVENYRLLQTDNYFCYVISVDMINNKAFVFIEELSTKTILYIKEITALDFSEISGVDKITIGGEYFLDGSTTNFSPDNYYHSQFNVIKDMYVNNASKVRALRMFMPYFETEMVGIEWWDDTNQIANGDFSTTDNWVTGTGWSINTVSGLARCDGSQSTVSDLTHTSFVLRHNEMTKIRIKLQNVTAGGILVCSTASVSVGYHPRFLSSDGTYDIPIEESGDTYFFIRATSSFAGEIDFVYGYRPKYNQNVTFGETKEIEWKDYPQRVVWTQPRGLNVPAAFYRDFKERVNGLIPVRGGNEEQDRAVTVVLTRNRFCTFMLEGSADAWAASPSAIIEAGENQGILQKYAWCEMDGILYWINEQGLMRCRDGRTVERLAVGQDGFDTIDLSITSGATYRLIPCPVRHQILIVRNS